MFLKFNPLKSKTFWGAMGTAIIFLAQHGVHPETLIQAASGVLVVLGLRDAQGPPK